MSFSLGDRDPRLVAFVRESNLIERITRDPTDREIEVTRDFLSLPQLRVGDLETLVSIYEPVAVIRDRFGLNVTVGTYTPPRGGPVIRERLAGIVTIVNRELASPWFVHVDYLKLHPFTDGNGRSSRALWAWQTRRRGLDPFSRSFLHNFYYQTLEAQDTFC